MLERLTSRFRKGTTDHDGDGKMGGSLKESTTMAKTTPAKKAPARKAAPKKAPATKAGTQATARKAPERDAAEQAAFDQGKRARSVAIPRDSDPHGKNSPLQEHWLAGWDDEDALREPMAKHEARVAKAQAERAQAQADEAAKAAAEAEKKAKA